MKRKLVALLLAISLIFSFHTAAFAQEYFPETYRDSGIVTTEDGGYIIPVYSEDVGSMVVSKFQQEIFLFVLKRELGKRFVLL